MSQAPDRAGILTEDVLQLVRSCLPQVLEVEVVCAMRCVAVGLHHSALCAGG
jgi:hypothetical protein